MASDAAAPVFIRRAASMKEERPKSDQPHKVHSLEMSRLHWDALSNDREWRTTLLFRGLPRELSVAGALEELFKSCGLWESVERIRVIPCRGRNLTSAYVKVSAVDRVAKIAKKFHGLQLGSAMPISVSFAPDAGLKPKRSTRNAPKDAPEALGEPKRVAVSVDVSLDLERSDVSTSDQNSDTDRAQGSHCPLPFGAPPGLEEFAGSNPFGLSRNPSLPRTWRSESLSSLPTMGFTGKLARW